jgi:redox-sensing transcriptional repressor
VKGRTNKKNNNVTSKKTIRRLCIYRRILSRAVAKGLTLIRSQDLARRAGVSPAQVRRDIMSVGYQGSPNKGYDCTRLFESIGEYLGADCIQTAILVGVGNLGKAILGYFDTRNLNITVVAAFDVDARIIGSVIHNCPCYSILDLEAVIKHLGIKLAIVAVPFREAQEVARQLVSAGIKGLLNFSPINLKLPEGIYVDDMDITAALETISFFTTNATA